MISTDRLRLAIQKSGRLSDNSLELLRRSGFRIRRQKDRFLAHCDALPVDIMFVRDDDIPGLIMDEIIDMGIIGENVLQEALHARGLAVEVPYRELTRLDFGECRVSIAIPEAAKYNGPSSLSGLTIATSYPQLLNEFLSSHGVRYQTCCLNGAVEIAPRAGLADAICDVVSTGGTLEANGLREVETIFQSSAVLVQSKHIRSAELENLAGKLLTRFRSVMSARESKYIMMHIPVEMLDAVATLLPGTESPTIIPLSGSNEKVALHVVSREKVFWETMEELQALGASSILVLPIEKMMV